LALRPSVPNIFRISNLPPIHWGGPGRKKIIAVIIVAGIMGSIGALRRKKKSK
jgi:hypothetical protein